MTNLAVIAYDVLYPEEKDKYLFIIKYSGKFTAYNASVQYAPYNMTYTFKLSAKWKEVSHDIVIGLIQHLILKLKKHKRKTLNIELYESFLKNISEYVSKTNVDPYLKLIYDQINIEYFNGMMGECNIKWGEFSTRTLGHYSFGSDMITISTVFKDLPPEEMKYLESVVYHEMLHKKYKFDSGYTRNRYHTTVFNNEEKKFKDFANIDKQMPYFIRAKIRKKRFTEVDAPVTERAKEFSGPKSKFRNVFVNRFFKWD